MNYRSQAIKLFTDKTKYKPNDIIFCRPIHKGFTNVSFKIKCKDKTQYQIRIGNDKNKVNRQNEWNVYKIIKFSYFIYYDKKNGNAIKKWINGTNPTYKQVCSMSFLKSFVKSLKTLHKIKTTHVLKHNYWDCFAKSKLPPKHENAYVNLVKSYENVEFVLSHNDLSPNNLIYIHDNQVIFIDYEWARLNNEYWDIANFIREVDLPIKWIKILCKLLQINNLNKLLTFVYLATNYAYQWTFNMPLTNKIKKYRQITYRKLEKYFKYIKS